MHVRQYVRARARSCATGCAARLRISDNIIHLHNTPYETSRAPVSPGGARQSWGCRRRAKAEALAGLLKGPKGLGSVHASEAESDEEGEVREARKRMRRAGAGPSAAAAASASGDAASIASAIAGPPRPPCRHPH